ncbi:MAG: carbohydrate ABC transporter permease [Angelakisella sp.]
MKNVKKVIIYLAASIFVIIWLLPVFYLIIVAIKPTNEFYMNGMFALPVHPTLKNFGIAWGKIGSFFGNSLIYVAVAIPLILLISTMAAYSLSRFEFKLKKYLIAYFMLGMLLPVHITLLPNYMTMKSLGLLNSRAGLIILYVVLNIPFTFFLTRGHFMGINKEIEESAKVDGCPSWLIFFRIILPMSAPILIIAVVMNYMNVWNDLVLAITYATDNSLMPVTAGLLRFVEEYAQNYEKMTAGILISIVPLTIVFICLQKYIVAGMAEGAIKG